MLSLTSAAYLPDKTLVGTSSTSLELLPGASAVRGRWTGGRRSVKLGMRAAKIRALPMV